MRITEDFAEIPASCRDQHLPMVPVYAAPFRQERIRGVGMHEVVDGYEIRRVGVAWHLALFTFAGKAEYQCAGESGVIRPNTLWVGPANVSYAYKAIGDWKFISVAFLAGEGRAHLNTTATYRPMTEDVEHMRTTAEVYLSESTRCGEGDSPAAAALAEYLALVINRELAVNFPAEQYGTQLQLQKLWETVNAAPEGTWMVRDLARRMAMSTRQFQRVMKKTYGLSAEKMLARLRMQRAQELLVSTDLPLAVIAERVGYQHVYSFSKAFKKYHGTSPGAFRKANR
jgi:AraC-like DNA-binding protein